MTAPNFYIECEIDGLRSRLTNWTRSKDGGFNLIIYQRSEGKKIMALKVRSAADVNGELWLDIWVNSCSFPISSIVERIITKR